MARMMRAFVCKGALLACVLVSVGCGNGQAGVPDASARDASSTEFRAGTGPEDTCVSDATIYQPCCVDGTIAPEGESCDRPWILENYCVDHRTVFSFVIQPTCSGSSTRCGGGVPIVLMDEDIECSTGQRCSEINGISACR